MVKVSGATKRFIGPNHPIDRERWGKAHTSRRGRHPAPEVAAHTTTPVTGRARETVGRGREVVSGQSADKSSGRD
jgi:hypothetical protein